MDDITIIMMMGVSIFLGSIALFAFLWAIKSGQFDDEDKFLNAVKFDGEEELNAAAQLQKKRESLEKSYKPK